MFAIHFEGIICDLFIVYNCDIDDVGHVSFRRRGPCSQNGLGLLA